MASSISRLKRLRHSHCDTCGCNRCKWIDAALAGSTPDTIRDDLWMVEGILTADGNGDLALLVEGQATPLAEALVGREGHTVTILIGGIPERAIDAIEETAPNDKKH